MQAKNHHWKSEYKSQVLNAQHTVFEYRGLSDSDLMTYVDENANSMGIMTSDPAANAQKALVLFALSGIQEYLRQNPGAVYDVLCKTKNVCMNPLNRLFKKTDIGSALDSIVQNIGKTSDTDKLYDDIIQFDRDLTKHQRHKLGKKMGLDDNDIEDIEIDMMKILNEERKLFEAGHKFTKPVRTRTIWSDKENARIVEKFIKYDRITNAKALADGNSRTFQDETYDQSWQHLVDIREAFDKLEGTNVKLKRWFRLWITILSKNSLPLLLITMFCLFIAASKGEIKENVDIRVSAYKLRIEKDKFENYTVKLYKNDVFVRDFQDMCPICMESHSNEEIEKKRICMTTECQHFFHCACSKQWFDDHKTCPMCRSVTTVQRL